MKPEPPVTNAVLAVPSTGAKLPARWVARRPPGYLLDMETEKQDHEEESSEKAAADSEPKKQAPEQDETDDTTWDTDQHSDAPGPFGTG